MKKPIYISYLIRIWQAADEKYGKGSWQCEVESVQTGQRTTLTSMKELVRLLQAQMGNQDVDFSESDHMQ